jgi:uncharacterized protein (DUF1330 family)
MSVYLIADIKIHDSEIYSEYIRLARSLVLAHGGCYRVQGGEPDPVSNWSPERIVMIEFPTMDSLQACFGSEQYKSIAPLRERSTTSRAIIVRGCEEEE